MANPNKLEAAVERSALIEALGLFPSMVRCGEPWTATCQGVLDRALSELADLKDRATKAKEDLASITRERDEALERERAQADTLKIIHDAAFKVRHAFGGRMSEVTQVFEHIVRVAANPTRAALVNGEGGK